MICKKWPELEGSSRTEGGSIIASCCSAHYLLKQLAAIIKQICDMSRSGLQPQMPEGANNRTAGLGLGLNAASVGYRGQCEDRGRSTEVIYSGSNPDYDSGDEKDTAGGDRRGQRVRHQQHVEPEYVHIWLCVLRVYLDGTRRDRDCLVWMKSDLWWDHLLWYIIRRQGGKLTD